ncbi:GNAT family N-acetyltransferase [Kribbella sp. CA-293567]|uniref:GNAT family N-acetyltransferase n=1 Tax=Kribbella sp. CA-293567 TaxID=3002436 RepID=UPI0022DDBCEE|nr:GNAT family N-acetyltransferase [Kribbella sp. CA-293567]WBQ08412.1 GNAT family N-acetyltransferase [Kribbella sp. CA-293567]
MMTTIAVLPRGYTVRAPEPADAEGIFELVSAHNLAVAGLVDSSLSDIADRLVEPGFDRRTDGFLVLSAEGRPAGYATTFGKAGLEMIEIEVTSQDPQVAAWLYEQAMRRALEMGREGGHAEITVDSCAYHDAPVGALLADHGFTVRTTYHQMRIEHTGRVAAPRPPAGVAVRRGTFDEATQWAAHEVILAAFRGQFGFVPRPHQEWVEFVDRSSIVSCGYLGRLGVLEEYRGRGLAKFLLSDAFALDAAAGRTGTILNVDTNNPTPALGLYLSAGMKPTLAMDGWRREVLVG